MSSRILQQDSSLLLTQANEPLINENFIATDSISTGSPAVSSTSLSQDHNLSATGVETGSPLPQDTSITQVHNLTVTAVVSGQVVIPSVGITQDHDLQADNISSPVPVVSDASITQDHDLQADNVSASTPDVSDASLTQDHELGAESISSPSPLVPTLTLVETENFAATSVETGVPEVDDTSLAQVYNLSPTGVLARTPVVDSANDPNAIIVKEIEEIQEMFGGWPRRAYEVPDGRLVQAEREIERTFGDKVSIDKKAKSLIKFGKSAELSTNGLATIWTVGGHETYVDDNLITHISSSSAADVYEVILECHTVEGTGVDQKFTFLTQTVTLQGQTKVALPTPVARVSEVTNNNSTELVGRVVVYEDVAVTNGIPNDESKIHIDIEAGMQNSFKAATTFSDSDYYVLTGGFGSVSSKQTGAADFFLEVRSAGKVFVQRAAVSASSGGPWNIELDPAVIIPKNSDVRITVETDTNNTVVFGVFKGYLAGITG